MSKQNNPPNDEFLQPLRDRSDLEPDLMFMKNVRNKITEQRRGNWLTRFTPVLVGSLTIVLISVMTTFYLHDNKPENNTPIDIPDVEENDEHKEEPNDNINDENKEELHEDINDETNEKSKEELKDEHNDESNDVVNDEQTHESTDGITILDDSEIRTVFEFDYGSEIENLNKPTGFFVRDDNFYIVDSLEDDSAHYKIVIINGDGTQSSIYISEDTYVGSNIYVDKQKNIYFINNSEGVVSKYNKDGKLENNYLIPSDSGIGASHGIVVNDNGEIIVKGSIYDGGEQKLMNINLMTGDLVEKTEILGSGVLAKHTKLNEKTREIVLEGLGEKQVINIEFEQQHNSTSVESVSRDHIIVRNSESFDEEWHYKQTHVKVIDKKSNVLGAVRIPYLYHDYHAPAEILAVDQNKIYILSTQKSKVIIYQLIPGQHFETKSKDVLKAEYEAYMFEMWGE